MRIADLQYCGIAGWPGLAFALALADMLVAPGLNGRMASRGTRKSGVVDRKFGALGLGGTCVLVCVSKEKRSGTGLDPGLSA